MNAKAFLLLSLACAPLMVAGPVKNGVDRYEFSYRLTLPADVAGAKLWVPIAILIDPLLEVDGKLASTVNSFRFKRR